MAKFSLEKYDVKAESSTSKKAPRKENPDALILDWSGVVCMCGCGGERAEKSRFLMGHDMKLKGKLNRAACADAPVVIVTDTGLQYGSAVDIATEMGWKANVTAALAAFQAPSKPRAAKNGKGVSASETRIIKVGRWPKEALVRTLVDGTFTAEWRTPDGISHRATSADGEKWAQQSN